jgi:hypothetical protein
MHLAHPNAPDLRFNHGQGRDSSHLVDGPNNRFKKEAAPRNNPSSNHSFIVHIW